MAASHTACIKDVMISLKRSELDVIAGISQSVLSVHQHHCLLVLVVPQLMTVGAKYKSSPCYAVICHSQWLRLEPSEPVFSSHWYPYESLVVAEGYPANIAAVCQ